MIGIVDDRTYVAGTLGLTSGVDGQYKAFSNIQVSFHGPWLVARDPDDGLTHVFSTARVVSILDLSEMDDG